MQQILKVFSLLIDVFNILSIMCKVFLLLQQSNIYILSCSGFENKFSLMEIANFLICLFHVLIDWY